MYFLRDLLQRPRPADDGMASDGERSHRPHAMGLSPMPSPLFTSTPLTVDPYATWPLDDALPSHGSRPVSPQRDDRLERNDLLQQLHARGPLTAEQQLTVLRALPALQGWPADMAVELRSDDGEAAHLRLLQPGQPGQSGRAATPVVLYRHADGQIGADAAVPPSERGLFGELLLALLRTEGGWQMLGRLIQCSRLSAFPKPQDFPRLEAQLRQRVIDTLADPRPDAGRWPASDRPRSPPARLDGLDWERQAHAAPMRPPLEATLSPLRDRSPIRTWTSPTGASTGAPFELPGFGGPPQRDQAIDHAQRPGAPWSGFLNPAPQPAISPSFELTGLSSASTLPRPLPQTLPGPSPHQLQKQLQAQQQQLHELFRRQADMQAQLDGHAQALSAIRVPLGESVSTTASSAFTPVTVVRGPGPAPARDPQAPGSSAIPAAALCDPPPPAARRLALQIELGAWSVEQADVVHRLLMMAPSWPRVPLRVDFRDDEPVEMNFARSGWTAAEDGSPTMVTLTYDMRANRYLRRGRPIRNDPDHTDVSTGANRFFDALMYSAPSEVINGIVVPFGRGPALRTSSIRRELAACQLRHEVYALARTPAFQHALCDSADGTMHNFSGIYSPAPGVNTVPPSAPATEAAEAITSGPTRASLG